MTAFVSRCYEQALKRGGDAGGLNHWCQQLMDHVQTPKQVASGFVLSQEMINRCNEIKEALRISTHRRPVWDAECLEALGLEVSYEADISSQVRQDEKLQYDNIPTFAVYGRK